MLASGRRAANRIIFIAVGLLLLLLATVDAQVQAPMQASIEGLVVKAGTTDPVQGVTVTATPDAGTPKKATSDEDGKFAIRDLAAGRYVLSLVKTGYVKPRRTGGLSNVSLVVGQRMTGVKQEMAAMAAVTGKVLDEDGNPLSGKMVYVVTPRYEMGRRILPFIPQTTTGLNARTDEHGEYRLYGIDPGEYFIAVSADRGLARYYPKAIDPDDAIPLMLSAASETGGIDFRIASLPLFTIRFKSSVPIEGISTSSTSKSSTVFFSIFSNGPVLQLNRRSRDGWDIRNVIPYGTGFVRTADGPQAGTILGPALPPGSYDLFMSGFTFDNGTGHIAFDITDHDLDLGGLTQVRIAPLTGRIQEANGVNLSTLSVTLTPTDGHDVLTTRVNATSARVAADGSFKFVNVLGGGTEPVGTIGDGVYQVGLNGLPANMYIATAKYGGRDVLDSGLHIEGTPNASLELAIAAGGSVQGVVKKANDTVSDSLVALIPSAAHRGNLNLYKTAFTDQNGNFTIRGVAPGDYQILAWEEVEPNAWLNSEFLKPFETQSQRISVIGTASTDVAVRVIPSR